MAYTQKEKAYQKKRYRTNKEYRDKLIKENTAKHKSDRQKYNKLARDYYHSNESYRKQKIAKMRLYNRRHKNKKSQ